MRERPAEAAPSRRRHAVHHVTEQTRTYPCAACGGQLQFDIGEQKLACPHCGVTRELAEAGDGPVRASDLRGAIAALRAQAGSDADALTGDKEVVCQSCGGHTTFSGTLTSTRCPYCATPIQRNDVHDAPARLPVDGILPFQIDAEDAAARLRKWIDSRWFAPGEFKSYSRTGSFASVYAAYFAYDADALTRYSGRRGDHYTVTVGSGKNQRTEVRTRWRPVSGQVRDTFEDLAVLANDGFDPRHVGALEPWPTHEARPYSPEYVAGHLCRTYDHDVEACFGQAEARMDAEIESTVRRDIGGDQQRITSRSTAYLSLAFSHLLLPIWLLTVVYRGRSFQVLMNGATGEISGERPWSPVKIAAAVALALVVLVAGLALYAGTGG